MIRAGAVLLLAVDQTSGFVGTSRRHKVTSRRYGCFWRNARVSSGSNACGFERPLLVGMKHSTGSTAALIRTCTVRSGTHRLLLQYPSTTAVVLIARVVCLVLAVRCRSKYSLYSS